MLSSILRAALTRDASSARLILLDKSPENRRGEMRLRLGQGENTRLYAYLDTLIIEKIGDQDQLILSDLKVDQYFGLTSGTPHPQSIAALQLREVETRRGFCWWVLSKTIGLTRKISVLPAAGITASAALNTKAQFSKVQNDKGWLSWHLMLYGPNLVMDKSGQIHLATLRL
jgi:hypothetical protein